MKRLNKNNGITLISLVITIIVMLILVGVSITLAVNGGLFEYAGNAVGDTKNAIKNEQGLIDDIIENYINTNVPIEGNDGEMFSPIYTKNTEITQGDYKATIPAGFAVGTSDGINKISTGLVIRDEKGNEFVWIPVKVEKEGDKKDTETSIASFYRSNWKANESTGGERGTEFTIPSGILFYEPLTSGGYENEEAEYNDMLKSVYTYEGFYIGRYEAGTETPRTKSTTGTTDDWVVQRDKYPYIYVGWGNEMNDYESDVSTYGKGALYLCKNFYTNEDKVGVTSTLCYGVMWDAMLDFIKDASYDVKDSTTWGNYYTNPWTISRKSAMWTLDLSLVWKSVGETGKSNEKGGSIILTTGANDDFSAKNIFDVAGNVYEWTNEAYSTSERTLRGGSYGTEGDYMPASSRCEVEPERIATFGFRPVLYITNDA